MNSSEIFRGYYKIQTIASENVEVTTISNNNETSVIVKVHAPGTVVIGDNNRDGFAIPRRELNIDMEKVEQLRKDKQELWRKMHGEMENPMPW